MLSAKSICCRHPKTFHFFVVDLMFQSIFNCLRNVLNRIDKNGCCRCRLTMSHFLQFKMGRFVVLSFSFLFFGSVLFGLLLSLPWNKRRPSWKEWCVLHRLYFECRFVMDTWHKMSEKRLDKCMWYECLLNIELYTTTDWVRVCVCLCCFSFLSSLALCEATEYFVHLLC